MYFSALASQIATLSAFLGGFAATFLATLLALSHQGRLMTFTVAFAVTSSVSFIVAVVAAMMLISILHPDAPSFVRVAGVAAPRAIMTLGFASGTLTLLVSLGCSGWSRTREIGGITTIAAALGTVLILGLTVRGGI